MVEIVEPYLSRFLARRDTSAGPDACWPWIAGRDNNGYGMTSISPIRKERAHRIAVFLDGREIPIGMTVDHLCRNKWCANPRHLEVVTTRENVTRGRFFSRLPACKYGHPTGPGDRTARWNCKTCRRIANLAYWHRKHPEAGYRT